MTMIEKKTSALIEASTRAGAILGSGSEEEIIRRFGLRLSAKKEPHNRPRRAPHAFSQWGPFLY